MGPGESFNRDLVGQGGTESLWARGRIRRLEPPRPEDAVPRAHNRRSPDDGSGTRARDSRLIRSPGPKWISASGVAGSGLCACVWGCGGKPARSFACAEQNMAVAVAACPLVASAACAPWRGGSRTRASAPMAARVERLRAAEMPGFGRDLSVLYGKRSCLFVGVRASQQSLEAAPIPAGYHTSVEQVKARLESERPDLPVGRNGRDDEDLILWFLRDRKFDVDLTVAKLIKALEWRREFGVDEITEASISRVAASGEAYFHDSLSKDGKPVIVVASAKHLPNDEQLLESERHCVYLIEKAISHLPPGCETFLGIFDLRGFKQKNGDLKFTKFLIDMFFKYYPKRLGQVLFVDAPFIFQPGWSMIKPLVGKYAALVRFCSADDVRNDYFTPDTIPKTFEQ